MEKEHEEFIYPKINKKITIVDKFVHLSFMTKVRVKDSNDIYRLMPVLKRFKFINNLGAYNDILHYTEVFNTYCFMTSHCQVTDHTDEIDPNQNSEIIRLIHLTKE